MTGDRLEERLDERRNGQEGYVDLNGRLRLLGTKKINKAIGIPPFAVDAELISFRGYHVSFWRVNGGLSDAEISYFTAAKGENVRPGRLYCIPPGTASINLPNLRKDNSYVKQGRLEFSPQAPAI